MQKSKEKRKNDESRNIFEAFRNRLKRDLSNLSPIHIAPLILAIILTILSFGLREQRMMTATSNPAIYPIVAIINNGLIRFLVFVLMSLVWLGILLSRARLIFLLNLPVIALLAFYTVGGLIFMEMEVLDSVLFNNNRYYVSRFDSIFRSIPSRNGGMGITFQPTHFILVHKCDSFGVSCSLTFEESDTPLSSDSPILNFEIEDNQLLLRRVDIGFKTSTEGSDIPTSVVIVEKILTQQYDE